VEALPNGKARSGQGLMEYALILLLVTIAVIGALLILGGRVSALLHGTERDSRPAQELGSAPVRR